MNIGLLHKENRSHYHILEYLDFQTYSVHMITFSDVGMDEFRILPVDVCVFDVIERQGNPEDILSLKQIRRVLPTTPILLATREGESARYRKQMLDLGVDGCIQVPFSEDELHLRLKKLARKKDSLLFPGTVIGAKGVTINIEDYMVKNGDVKVNLTKTEYCILLHLLWHKNTIVSSETLMTCLDQKARPDSSALNIHIFNIRKKLKNPNIIKTIPLYGFTISDQK